MVVRYAASVSTREGTVSEAPALFHPIDACDGAAVAVAAADNAVTSRDREGRMTDDDDDDDDDDDRDEEDEDEEDDGNDDEDVLRC